MVNLMEKLEALAARYDELQTRLSQPETVADMDNFRRLMKEHADMEELMAAYREYRATADNLAGAREMLEDADLCEMAKEEIAQLEPRKEELEKRLQLLLLPKDPNDERNVILEIRAGTGGEEAALFASELARMYGHYADARGWRCEELDANLTELGGVKELSLRIEGQGAYSRLKYESGAHRVQRVPETESGGRIHTSAATVAVMPEVDDVEVEINPNDPHGLGRAHHAHPDRHRRPVPERAQPDPEPRAGHAHAPRAPVGQGPAGAAGGGLRLPQEPGRLRRPVRAHPHL